MQAQHQAHAYQLSARYINHLLTITWPMKQKEIFNFLMKVAVISWNCFEILTPGLIEVNTTQIRLSKYLLYVRFEILE